jgi:hypothetical protein
MTKAVVEAGSETAAARAIAAVPSPTLAVPASLYASLMARLDRLGGPAKELAQIAAAIGREFSHALLASVVPQPEAGLTSALDRLIAAGLLFRRGMPPHATYCSSMPSCRMPLTGRCCVRRDDSSTAELPKPLRTTSLARSKRSRS